ncbi:MAG: hypothetical protein P1V97_30295, partial [Planctomycetota bacterium]|nr:hypothetical protein [Planctomycetota bacterium]
MIEYDDIDEIDVYFAKFIAGALVVSALFIVGGIYQVNLALNNTKKVELSISELLEKRPESAWIRVTGGTLDLTRAFAEFRIGEDGQRRGISRVYVPLIDPDAGEDAPFRILVSSRDIEYQSLVLEKESLAEEAFKRRVKMGPALWYRERAVSGMINYDSSDSGNDREDLEKLAGESLPKELAIVKSGQKPILIGAIVMIAAGLFVPSVLFFIFYRKFKEKSRIRKRRQEREARKAEAEERTAPTDVSLPPKRK